MVDIDPDEYEWLVFSEKMFRMIALTHCCVQEYIGRPIWFEYSPDPVKKQVKFKVRYRQVTEEYKIFKFILKVEDWSVDEILARIQLAYHSADVWRP